MFWINIFFRIFMLRNEMYQMKVTLTVALTTTYKRRIGKMCKNIQHHSSRYSSSPAFKSRAGSISFVWHHSRKVSNFRNGRKIPRHP
jgi:hypothetical protein